MVGKNFIKKNSLFIGMFVIGMFTVSIANFFGGYYCSVLAAITVLATIYVFNILDNETINENKFNLIMIGVLLLSELVFFAVNDIFGHSVYVKGNIDFFGGFVIAVQIYSVVVSIYSLVNFVLIFSKKETIELVDDEKRIIVDEKDEELHVEEKNIKKEEEDLKRIARSDFKKDVPFMEEEK